MSVLLKSEDIGMVFFGNLYLFTQRHNSTHSFHIFGEIVMKMLHTAMVQGAFTALSLGAFCFASAPVTLHAQSPVDAGNSPTARSTPRTTTSRASSVDNLGVRYLKLGNSYREARNYDLAQTYLKRGLDMVRNRNTYWEAAGYEYLGLLYRDMGDRQMSLEYLRTAASLYDRVVNMRNSMGSDEVLRSVIADVEQGAQIPPGRIRPPYPADAGAVVATDGRLQDENRRLQDENRNLISKINDLEARIRQLETGLSANPGMSLKSPMSVDMSDCKRDLEGIARYRESTLWLNGYAPIDFSTRDVRITGGGARVDGTIIVGYLKRGESAKIEVTMPLGQYVIVADGCAPKARDIDVRIINQQGVVLEKKDIRFSGSMPNPAPSNNANNTNNTSSTTTSNETAGNRPADTTQTQPQTRPASENTTPSTTPPVDDSLRNKPSTTREALAKVGWNNEYGGVHTFLVTMYECDAEGAYFCLLIGKK
jgi:hypothetical protein